MTNIIKVVAVDDSEEYLESIKPIFSPFKDSYQLAYCFSKFSEEGNVEFMLERLGRIKPDVILMDYSFVLAGQTADYGVSLVNKILAKFPEQNIIMLVGDDADTVEERWKKIQRSFQAGAKAYLGKRDIAAWRDAIAEVVNGERFVDKRAVQTILNGIGKEVDDSFNLTERQKEILTHLATDKTIQQAASCIQGPNDKTITISAVNFHLRNIRARLHCKTLHGTIAKAIRKKIIE